MKRVRGISTVLFILFFISSVLFFQGRHTFANGDVFRVAYLEGDPYINYAGSLSGLTEGLSARGIVKQTGGWDFREGSDDASVIWNWLGNHSTDKVEFVRDEFYQLIFMSEEEKTEFIRHMNHDGEIDLILVMGTAAAKFIKESGIDTDAMILSVTNAYQAGIVNGIEYSGIDNFWAHISPNRYYNQLNVFYDLFQFHKLGIAYEDSENGRNEIAYDDIRRFAKNKGLELIEEAVDADQKTDGPALYEKKMMEGYRALAGKADAVYMTNCGYRTAAKIPEYLEPLYHLGIPVFSQTGKNDVKNGATMTIVRYSFSEIGNFCAEQFMKLMEGKRPGELVQSYDESQSICLNIAAAEQAGLQLPFKALLSADNLYTEIGEGNE